MRPLPKSRVTLALVLLAVALSGVWVVRCVRREKPAAPPTLPGNPPIRNEPQATPAGEFTDPVSGGVRRFAAPHGEEVTGFSVAPDGSLLAAVTAKHLYLFDSGLEPRAVVDLPGLPPGRQVVALGPGEVAVWNTVPSAQTETRVLRVTMEEGGAKWRVAEEERVGGEVAFGAAVAGHLVLVAREPATVAVFDPKGKLIAQNEIAANPQRIDVSPDGSWAAVASAGDVGAGYAGVLAVDLSGGTPQFTKVNTGPGVFRPVIALPLGDAVLVAGSAESNRPLAVVAPLAGGDLRARIPLGEGIVVGAARSASGERAVVFVNQPKGEGVTESRAIVLDTKTWATQSQLAAGPSRPGNQAVALGERVVVAACHSAPILDLPAGTVDPGQTFPSPGEGPCMDGVHRLGDHLVARVARRVLVWPVPR